MAGLGASTDTVNNRMLQPRLDRPVLFRFQKFLVKKDFLEYKNEPYSVRIDKVRKSK